MSIETIIPTNLKSRDRYINRLRPYIGKNIIKVITGQRRVGKSYIMFLIIKEILRRDETTHIVYLNLEDIRYDYIDNYETLYNVVESAIGDSTNCAVFIDEIQGVAGFEKVVRSLLLRQGIDIYITGSNSKMLSGELATYLTGRYYALQVNSLAYDEFCDFHGLDESDATLEKYMRFGGMPYLVNMQLNDSVAFEYLQTVLTNIVYKDVVERFAVRNTNFLNRLVNFVSDNIGNLFTSKSTSDFLKSRGIKISPTLVLNYMDYLVQSFVISKVNRYDIIGKRIFEIGEKYYFGDIGLRNAIAGYRPDSRGQILENIIYNHLIYLGYNVMIGANGSKEIDFIATRANETVYVQASLMLVDEMTVNREFGNLLEIADNYPKYVVSLDSSVGNTLQGVRHLSLRDFLKARDL